MTELKAYAVVAQAAQHIASRIWPLPEGLAANIHPQAINETAPPPPLKKDTYKALYDLHGRSASQLSLAKDEIIEIVRQENNGELLLEPSFFPTYRARSLDWWLSQKLNGSIQGWLPCAYLVPEPEATRLTTPPPSSDGLLILPVDLLHSIFDFLPLPAKIISTQLCKDLQRLFQSRCSSELLTASPSERLECVEILAQVLSGYRLCYSCQALHSLNSDSRYLSCVFNITYDAPPCPALDLSWTGHPVLGSCPVAFRHVQKVIGYCKVSEEHRERLEKLLPKFDYRSSDFWGMRLIVSTRIQIKQGRFTLRSLWNFFGINGRQISRETLLAATFRICPHLGCGSPFPTQNDALKLSILDMFSNLDEGQVLCLGQLASCIACPTDFLLCAIGGGTRVKITVFQDLGTGQTLDDEYWTSHRVGERNNMHDYIPFAYQHGSIRSLCL